MKRVVVTGIGAVTPLGNSFSGSWERMARGESGIATVARFDASHLPWRLAGELKGFCPEAYQERKEIIRTDPFIHYAVAAAVMTAEDAALISSDPSPVMQYALPASAGVIIGSSRGGISTIERALIKSRAQDVKSETRKRPSSPYLMPSSTVSMAASYAARKLGAKGNCLGISNACASGANAVGEAFRLIRSGYARLVIAGGSEAPVCRLCMEGYGVSGVLSTHRCARGEAGAPRPFDRGRDGFVLSEGACLLALEEYDSAVRRGAAIYGEIIGYANTTDSFHMTKPDAEGESAAIVAALDEAGITPGEVDYINTHGTGTRIGDSAEARAVGTVFGSRASAIPATAVKSATGHMLAASGAFEIACTLMSLREGIIPPTINLGDRDPECNINIVTEKRDADIRIALSNSFGFGGVNAVVVLKSMG
ncbi:MAG: beta-ketoacyl-[acyl-carrier-protein] synthase family protein [Nitrospirae bacterium]|nr:beta-ketoacyl-[acyl-carrier-protein] synthase family protein [Nitrospirota bacterium]